MSRSGQEAQQRIEHVKLAPTVVVSDRCHDIIFPLTHDRVYALLGHTRWVRYVRVAGAVAVQGTYEVRYSRKKNKAAQKNMKIEAFNTQRSERF
jgi:hypothetical protein